MPRKQDPVALGRRLIRGPFYWILVVARLVSFVPCLVSAAAHFRDAYRCLQVSAPLVFCAPDTFLPGLWALVCAYMTYCAADGLMVRWLLTYSRPAALVRMIAVSLTTVLLTRIMATIGTRSPTVALQVWVVSSCFMTFIYILQSFIASNLAQKTRERTLNLFRIAVYAVVPVGMASFITMLGLIRTVMLLQYHVKGAPALGF